MIRRRFLGFMTLAGAGGIATLSKAAATEKRSVAYKVSGFTCVTCAVGLETLLHREKGVLSASASYPDGTTLITFNPAVISEQQINAVIDSMGFHAEPIARGKTS